MPTPPLHNLAADNETLARHYRRLSIGIMAAILVNGREQDPAVQNDEYRVDLDKAVSDATYLYLKTCEEIDEVEDEPESTAGSGGGVLDRAPAGDPRGGSDPA